MGYCIALRSDIHIAYCLNIDILCVCLNKIVCMCICHHASDGGKRDRKGCFRLSVCLAVRIRTDCHILADSIAAALDISLICRCSIGVCGVDVNTYECDLDIFIFSGSRRSGDRFCFRMIQKRFYCQVRSDFAAFTCHVQECLLLCRKGRCDHIHTDADGSNDRTGSNCRIGTDRSVCQDLRLALRYDTACSADGSFTLHTDIRIGDIGGYVSERQFHAFLGLCCFSIGFGSIICLYIQVCGLDASASCHDGLEFRVCLRVGHHKTKTEQCRAAAA